MPKPKQHPAVIDDAAEGSPRNTDETRGPGGTVCTDIERPDRSRKAAPRLESYERDDTQQRKRSESNLASIRPNAND